jgi:hypothetical protein
MAVADALSCLEAWLEQFRADDRQVPPSFDHAFLVEALEVLLPPFSSPTNRRPAGHGHHRMLLLTLSRVTRSRRS